MSQVSGLFQFLMSAAGISTAVFLVGALILRMLRQPIERVRCIQFSLAASVVAIVVQQTALLPSLSLPVLPSRVSQVDPENSESATRRATSARALDERLALQPNEVEKSSIDSSVEMFEPEIRSMEEQNLFLADLPRTVSLWSIFQVICVLAAVIAGVGFLALIIVGHRRLAVLLSQCEQAAPMILASWTHAAEVSQRGVQVLVSNSVNVPIAFGIRRPVIVLPQRIVKSDDPRTIAYCLSHEWAHIKFHDVATWWLVQCLTVVFWFQPLFWNLRRELRTAQDQLADDFATGHSPDRTDYASLLTRMAHERLGVASHLALSMAGRRTSLFRRVEMLLTANFRLTSSVRRRVVLGMTTCLAVLVVGLGTMRLDYAAARPQADDSTPSAEESVATKSEDFIAQSYSGRVVDVEGKAVPDATLWVSMTIYTAGDPRPEVSVQEVGQTDDQGEFRFDVDDSLLNQLNGLKIDILSGPAVIARGDGLGFSGLPLAVFAVDAPASERRDGLKRSVDKAFGDGCFDRRMITLPRLGNEVHGRLLDLEGSPLPDVAVSVEKVESPVMDVLLKALQKASSDEIANARQTPWIARTSRASAKLLQQLQPPIVTDANGEFHFTGLGQDQVAVLTFAAERVESQRVYVLGREMETQRVPHLSFYPQGAKDIYHGTQFTHVLGLSIPITGVVTEFQSGKPIANATVYVERLFREQNIRRPDSQLRLGASHINATTDANGHFTLHGVPVGGEHVLQTVPPKTEPWLMASNTISLRSDEEQCTVNVQVFRGIWIEGQLADGKTQEPLAGQVDYLALQKNPHIPQAFGLHDAWEANRFPIEESGHYRVPGLPGPGVLLARSHGATQYPLGIGAEGIDGYKPRMGLNFLPTTPTGMPISNWNLIQQIDPPADATSFVLDLTLTAGNSVPGRVVGPDGSDISGLQVIGLVEKDQFWSAQKDSSFSVQNYDGVGPRQLHFKAMDSSLVGEIQLSGEAPKDLVVTLQPSVTVKGRLIETEKDEPAVGYSIYCLKSSRGEFRVGGNSGTESIVTDDNGRFEIQGLLAGMTYTMDSANVQHFSSQKNGFTIDLTNVPPGTTLDLGDVTGKNSNP